MLITMLYNIISTVLSSAFLIFVKAFFDKKQNHQESKEIQEDVDKIMRITLKSDDVIDLMLKNVRELREYYVISKRQANSAFSASLIVCFLGFVIYIAGIVVFSSGKNALLLTTIAGTIVEVISGLFFLLYRHTIIQLNIYHRRLGTTEKYLTAIQLVDKMALDRHDDMYRFIIERVLIDNHMQSKETDEKEQ